MSLEETIAYLEEYFRGTCRGCYGQKELELRNKVEEAFCFSEDELEEAFKTHPDFAFVRFSEIQYYQRGESSICGIEKSNLYITAILHRVLATTFKTEFGNAELYESWSEFNEAAQEKGVGKERSERTKLVKKMLEKAEQSGYGCITEETTQKGCETLIPGDPCWRTFTKLVDDGWQRKMATFVEKKDGSIQFEVCIPSLKDFLMSLASEKFKGLGRKRIKPED